MQLTARALNPGGVVPDAYVVTARMLFELRLRGPDAGRSTCAVNCASAIRADEHLGPLYFAPYIDPMCGRVVQASEPLRYAFVDGLAMPDSRIRPPSYNVAPSQELYVHPP